MEFEEGMPKPIFVVGVHRSGTTWLANILCQHSKIAGIQHERHFGIHESAFFDGIMGNFGDLRNDNDFIQFVEIFAISDYFLLSRLDKNIFYKERPNTYQDFFRILMDCFAEKEKVDFWLEKTPAHTIYLEKISEYFPDSKFVSIKRNIVDTIKSTIKMQYYTSNENISMIPRPFITIYLIYRYIKYYKYIEHFCKKSNSIKVINYEELKKSPEPVITNLCKFLDIEFESNMLKKKYKPNTSFSDNQERKEVLTSTEKWLIKLFAPLCTILPYRLYSALDPIERSLRKSELPLWFYSIMREEKLGK